MTHNNQDVPGALALASKINKWEYDASVERMRPVIKALDKDMRFVLRELYIAREYLIHQKGQHKDPQADDYIIYTWSGYCAEIGLKYQTANNWLRQFGPKELSGGRKDATPLFDEAPAQPESASSRALTDARVAEVLQTGRRPRDWTDTEERELKRQLENARLREVVDRFCSSRPPKTTTDHFEMAMKHSKTITSFELETIERKTALYDVFEHIQAFLNTFKDISVRTTAAFYIALKAKNFVNELAEVNFQMLLHPANDGDGGTINVTGGRANDA